MSFLVDILKSLLAARREQVVDGRDLTKMLADELENLADLMSQVLAATDARGKIDSEKIVELDRLRQRNWNRWVTILESDSYHKQEPDMRAEIHRCVRIAHAAPGSYIDEIFSVQKGLASAYLPIEIRNHFANSIDRIHDTVTKMRLNVQK